MLKKYEKKALNLFFFLILSSKGYFFPQFDKSTDMEKYEFEHNPLDNNQ